MLGIGDVINHQELKNECDVDLSRGDLISQNFTGSAIYDDVMICTYLDGKPHNVNGPARVRLDPNIAEDGSTTVLYVDFWINGKKIRDEDFLTKSRAYKLRSIING